MSRLNVKTDKDVRDKERLAAGVRPNSVKDESLDPVVSYGPELAPTSKYIWDTLEDMEAKDCIAKGVEIDAWRPLRKPKFGKVKDIKPEQKGLNLMLKYLVESIEGVSEKYGLLYSVIGFILLPIVYKVTNAYKAAVNDYEGANDNKSANDYKAVSMMAPATTRPTMLTRPPTATRPPMTTRPPPGAGVRPPTVTRPRAGTRLPMTRSASQPTTPGAW